MIKLEPIIIPGNCIVKKNTAKTSNYYKDKYGRTVPRQAPVHYYTPEYKEWAKNGITAIIAWMSHQTTQFPIQEKVNLRILYHYSINRIVDMSALHEGVQDLLAGNAGVYKDTIPSKYYNVIEDDSVRYVGSHDGSRFILNPVEPRTEIYIEPYIP